MHSNKPEKEKPKGPVIPAGTEQETGITRGQTEKPDEELESGLDNSSVKKPAENGSLNEKNN